MTNDQIHNLQVAYSIGKITRANDGMSFEKTLSSIVLRESSARNNQIGDDRFNDRSKKPTIESSLGLAQVKVSTAKEVARKVKSLNWVNLLSDEMIAGFLLKNNQFNVLIAAHYIRMNYNRALKRRMWNPLFKTISRYNGGWNNKIYYHKVMEDMKVIEKLIKRGDIQ
jgi:hypothetical protein